MATWPPAVGLMVTWLHSTPVKELFCRWRRGLLWLAKGRRIRCWVTWPDVIGLRTVAGGGRLLRGGNFTATDDVQLG